MILQMCDEKRLFCPSSCEVFWIDPQDFAGNLAAECLGHPPLSMSLFLGNPNTRTDAWKARPMWHWRYIKVELHLEGSKNLQINDQLLWTPLWLMFHRGEDKNAVTSCSLQWDEHLITTFCAVCHRYELPQLGSWWDRHLSGTLPQRNRISKGHKMRRLKTNKHIQKSDLFHATIFMEREIPALIFFSIRCTERDL